jgi:hypothetical protein
MCKAWCSHCTMHFFFILLLGKAWTQTGMPFPRLSEFSTFDGFKQSNFVLIYTNTDRSVNVRSGTSSYYALDLNTTTVKFLFSYDRFSLVGTLRAILDSTGNFTYLVVVDNYKTQIFKMNIRENSPWEAVVNANGLQFPYGAYFVDGPLSTARYGYITRVMSPRNATFFLIADCDSRAIRRVDFQQNYVKTIIDGTPYQQFLAVDLSPSGSFFVWEQNNMLFMYKFPLDWSPSSVNGENVEVLTAGGEGYVDGSLDQTKISYVKSMVISPDDKWVYFAHNYLVGMYIRGVNLVTKVTSTFYSNTSTTQQPTFLAMGRSPDVLWMSCVNPGAIWQFQVGSSGMTVMAHYSVDNVMSLSVWTSYVSNLPGYDAFSDYRFLQACPPGKYDSGMMYCENCPESTFNVDYSATQCTQCPVDEAMVITGTSNRFAAENACPRNRTASVLPPTTTSAALTTTSPSFPLPIQPLKRVFPTVGEYCTNFRAASIDLRGVWDCGSISNVFGCNGTWALIGFNGVVCPWELGQGCSASLYPNFDTPSCYINCESGCLNKSRCNNIPLNAYFTGMGQNMANNCPWSCNSNYKQVGQECIVDESKNIPLPPPTVLKRCITHLDCMHCPSVGFKSNSLLYRVMGCSGYGVHLYVEGINYGSLDSLTYFLASAYCVYYLNESYAEYCPDPTTTSALVTTTPETTPQPVIPIATNVVLAKVTTTALTNPRFTCTMYKNCSYCPSTFTSGCSGVNVVQRFPNGMLGVIMPRYTPPGMMQGKCVYLENTWKYCPEDNLIFPEPKVVKVVLGFSFAVPERVIDDTVLAKYKRIISVYLNISEEIIFLTLSSSVSTQRRLLAENVVYGNIQVDPNQASVIINLMNSAGFKNALLNSSASEVTVFNYDVLESVEALPVQTTSKRVYVWPPSDNPGVKNTHNESWDMKNTAFIFIMIGVLCAICFVSCLCLYIYKQTSTENQLYETEMLIQKGRENEQRTNDIIQKVLWKKIKK